MDKVKSRETITLVNNENIESNENEVAKPFDDFFSNIVKNPTKFRSSSVKMIYTIDYPVIQPCKLYESIGITQALVTFGISQKGSQAFVFHKSIQMLYSRMPIFPSKF